MKTLLILLGTCLAAATQAQPTDTILVSHTSTVSLLFPEPITLINLGNADYQARLDGNLVMLKANQANGSITNLLIRYGNNQYFTGYIRYANRNLKHYLDFRPAQKLPHRSRKPNSGTATAKEPPAIHQRLKTVMALPKYYTQLHKTKDNIGLRLREIRNGPTHTYLAFSLHNTSTIPFHIRTIQVRYREKKSTQSLAPLTKELELSVTEFPSKVPPQSQVLLGCAFPHFGPRKRGKLEIIISEQNGTRSITLPLRSTFLIHAPLLNDYEK